jgi:outer membrane protein W
MPKSTTQRSEEEEQMRLVRALVLIAMIALAVPQLAAAADMKHSLGLSAGYFGPTGKLNTDWFVAEVSAPTEFKFQNTGVFGLAYQYRFNEKISLGASFLYANPDLKATSTTSGKSGTVGNATFMPLLIDGNIHVLKNTSSVDFFLGPTLGYATWGDLKPTGYSSQLGIEGSQKLKSDFVYGLDRKSVV